jgi:hypothetical protein
MTYRITVARGTERRECSRAQSPRRSVGGGRERHLILKGPTRVSKEVPTLHEFAPRFVEGHAEANQQKASGIHAKRVILRVHLLPFLGDKRLDAITTEDVQRLKSTCRVR